MLEEIRFLLNTHLDSKSPMGLVLTGQTELWKKLQLQAYEAIRQRIDVQSVLNHYDRSQTGAYIRSHLAYAGVTNEIFTETAMDEIHQYTAGTARMILEQGTVIQTAKKDRCSHGCMCTAAPKRTLKYICPSDG